MDIDAVLVRNFYTLFSASVAAVLFAIVYIGFLQHLSHVF